MYKTRRKQRDFNYQPQLVFSPDFWTNFDPACSNRSIPNPISEDLAFTGEEPPRNQNLSLELAILNRKRLK